jgi:hypothetical protein
MVAVASGKKGNRMVQPERPGPVLDNVRASADSSRWTLSPEKLGANLREPVKIK